jgi:small subunit ribosomal protein S16
VAVKIKLKRLGKIRQPMYRIVIADARTARNGRAIEEIGVYRPKEDPSFIQVDSERVQYWLSVGAQPTEAVTAILKVTGDWQSFKGLPAPAPMKVAVKPPTKQELFAVAAKEAAEEPKDGATTPKAKKTPKADEAPAAAAPVEEAVVVADAPVAEEAAPATEEAVVAEAVVEEVATEETAPATEEAPAAETTEA